MLMHEDIENATAGPNFFVTGLDPVTISVLVAHDAVEVARDDYVPQHRVGAVAIVRRDHAAGVVRGLGGLNAIDTAVDEDVQQAALLSEAQIDTADGGVIICTDLQVLPGPKTTVFGV